MKLETNSASGKPEGKPFLFAMNRKLNRAEPMIGFVCFEHLQGAFRCGIRLSDGTSADAIGRTKNAHEFLTRAAKGKTEVIVHGDFPAELTIRLPYGKFTQVSFDVFRSWTGKRKVDGKTFTGPCYYWLSKEIAA